MWFRFSSASPVSRSARFSSRSVVLGVAVALVASLAAVVPPSPAIAQASETPAPLSSLRSGTFFVPGPVSGFGQVGVSSVGRDELEKPGWPEGVEAESDGDVLDVPGVVEVEFPEGAREPGAKLEVEVMSKEAAEDVSPVSAAVAVNFADGRSVSDGSSLRFTFDLSDIGFVYGGDLRQRIRPVVLTGCSVSRSGVTECEDRVELPSELTADGRLAVEVDEDLISRGAPAPRADVPDADAPRVDEGGASVDGAGLSASSPGSSAVSSSLGSSASLLAPVGGMSVIAMSSSTSSASGDYAATPFAPLATYQVGLFTGAAETAYTVPLPPAAAGGLAPDVTLRYSSGGVDGLNGDKNAQVSWVGVGWDYEPGSVSMHLPTCPSGTHLCWDDDVTYMLNVNGVRSRLVPNGSDPNLFHVQADPLWRVERKTAPNTPDAHNVYWLVTTRDGTEYRFGGEFDPRTGADQDSAAWVPVSGVPGCSGLCDKTYRWNLDWVEDTSGNAMAFFYDQESNNYATGIDYVRSSYVKRIEYTRVEGSSSVPVKVEFTTTDRCVGACAQAIDFPDTPLDLECTTSSCGNNTKPSFWSDRRLSEIVVSVDNGGWEVASRHKLIASFPAPPPDQQGDTSDPKLWLDRIERRSGSGALLGSVSFTDTMLANRVNYSPVGVPPMRIPRISTITTMLGGTVAFGYSAPSTSSAACPRPNSWADNHTHCFPEYDPYTNGGGTVIWNKYVVETETHTDPIAGSPTSVWSYAYEHPSWHITDFPYRDREYHSDFRGHREVTVIAPDGVKTEHRFFQGMDGDSFGATTKDVSVTNSAGGSFTDHNWLAGRTLEERLLSATNTVHERTLYWYEDRVTQSDGATSPGPTPNQSDIVPLVGDWDGTGTDDAGYYNRTEEAFYVPAAYPYGNPGDEPIVGDWDGNGVTDIGVYRPSNQTFYRDGHPAILYGNPNDVPIIGDWDGDGDDDIGVYRPSNQTYYRNGHPAIAHGNPGDVPMIGDWDGNGSDDVGAYRPSNSTFYPHGLPAIAHGDPGDDPFIGDWTGNGTVEAGIYREPQGTAPLYARRGQTAINFGNAGDSPIIGDWDGDGDDDIGAYRFSTHTFHLRHGNGSVEEFTLGEWGAGGARDARWVAVTETKHTSFGTSFGDTKTTVTDYQYDLYGNATTVIESGDGQARTTTTTFKHDLNQHIVDRVGTVSIWDGAGAGTAGDEESHTESFYTSPSNPTKPTVVRTWTQRGASPEWFDVKSTYDTAGRPLTTTDGENNTTTTTYHTVHGYPLTVTNAAGHVTETKGYDPKWGVPTWIEDANDHATRLAYNQFGQLEKVALAGDTLASPTITYAYDIHVSQPSTITTTRDTGHATPTVTVEYLDGFGRTIQTRSTSPDNAGHSAVVSMSYDDNGRLERVTDPYELSGLPGAGYVSLGTGEWSQQHTKTYFGVRGAERTELRSNGMAHWEVIDKSDGWQRQLIDAKNNETRHYFDVFGNLVKVDEYDNAQVYASTTYTYTAAGLLETVTDAASNVTTVTYDRAGRKTQMADPDMGTWSYEYDDVGNLTSQTDGRGQTLHFTYDQLNRMETKRADSAGGTLLAEWRYDPVGHLGLLDQTIAYYPDGNVTVDYDDYSNRNELERKTWTIPGPAGGTYTMQWTYRNDGQVETVTYPGDDTGGLGETVHHTYNAAGMLETLVGNGTYTDDDYVTGSDYTPWGAIDARTLGAGTDAITASNSYRADDRRLGSTVASVNAGPTLFDRTYEYDDNGNITWILDATNANQRQCFFYDRLDRLTDAYTTGGLCTGANTSIGDGGYDHTYTYDPIGNLRSGPLGAYTYGAGPAGPHAVTSIGSTHTYTHDANGNQITRTTPGIDQTLTWDESNRLAEVADPSAATTTMRYDADGNRVTRSVAGDPGTPGTSGTLDIPVTANGDDLYVDSGGFYSDTTGNLWFGRHDNGSTTNDQGIYVRFANVAIPAGATITNAYVTFRLDDRNAVVDDTATVVLHDTDNAVPPSSQPAFDALPRTTANASWPMVATWPWDHAAQTPDLKTALQEVVDRAGWVQGNAVGVIVEDPTPGSGTNNWGFVAHDINPSRAAVLHIDYTTGSGGGGGGGGGTTGTVDRTISADADDVMVDSSGFHSTTTGNLWFGVWNDSGTIKDESLYLRFTNITVPVGATVTNAYVTMRLDDHYGSADDTATVRLANVDDAQVPWSYSAFTSMARTTQTASWPMIANWPWDTQAQSPDLTALVQAVVDRPGWASGNAVGVFVEDPTPGTSTNDWGFVAYDINPSRAATIHIEYTVPGSAGPTTDTAYIGDWQHVTVTDAGTDTTNHYRAGTALVGYRNTDGYSIVVGDHLGSTTVTYNTVTDTATTSLYGPWGNQRGGDTPDTDYTYTGQIADYATGLMNYRARYYDPTIGRFISPDSIIPNPADPQQHNRYTYVTNNPLKYTDPTGHCTMWDSEFGCTFWGEDDRVISAGGVPPGQATGTFSLSAGAATAIEVAGVVLDTGEIVDAFGVATTAAGTTLRSGASSAARSEAALWLATLGKSETLTNLGRVGRSLRPAFRHAPWVGGAFVLTANLSEDQSIDRALVESAAEIGVGTYAMAGAVTVCASVSAGTCLVVIGGVTVLVMGAGEPIGEGVGWLWDRAKGAGRWLINSLVPGS